LKRKTIIIAEAGVNHNKNINIAKNLISKAATLGVNYIKFQLFDPELIVKKNTSLAEYQKKNSSFSNQFDLLKNLSLDKKQIDTLYNFCKKKKLGFLCSPFDINSAQILKKYNLDFLKIPSGEITNYPLIDFIAKNFSRIILSTGMSTISEIRECLKHLTKYNIKRKNITLMHCTSAYPANYKELNLLALNLLEKEFKLSLGYSDHSQLILTPSIAVSLGARIIEKHFTINKNYKGPDHKASLNPSEFKKMIEMIEITENILGVEKKIVTNTEKKNMLVVRKGIYARINIKKGDKFSEKNLITLRPLKGFSAIKWPFLIGTKSKRNYKKFQTIE
jgi:N,N'-diacetyllegionaminate synthase